MVAPRFVDDGEWEAATDAVTSSRARACGAPCRPRTAAGSAAGWRCDLRRYRGLDGSREHAPTG